MTENTVQTLQTELKDAGLEVPEAVAEGLVKGGYTSVELLKQFPPTDQQLADPNGMGIAMPLFRNMILTFAKPETAAPATHSQAQPTQDDDPLANLLDFKEVNWTRRHVQRLTEAQVAHLMTTVLTKGDGWDFLTWAEREYGKKLAVKRAGAFAPDATAYLVMKLKEDKYPVQSDIVVFNDEDLIVVSVREIGQTSDKNRRDVFVPYGTVSDEGTSALMQLKLYESGTGNAVVDEALLQMLEIAWKAEFKSSPTLPMAVATMMSMNPAVKARDLKGMFPQSYAELVKRQQGVGNGELPDLKGPGEGDANFNSAPEQAGATTTAVDQSDDTALQAKLDEITESFPFEKWVEEIWFLGEQWNVYQYKHSRNVRGLKFSRTGIRDVPIQVPLKVDTIRLVLTRDWEGTNVEYFINELYAALSEHFVGTFTVQDRRRLRMNITSSFNLDEIRTLCYDLGVVYENLRGDTRDAKINALIDHFVSRKELEMLMAELRSQRPNTAW